MVTAPEPPPPITAITETVSFPHLPTTTTTIAAPHSQLTYVTQGNISYRFQPDIEVASNATTTTINVPTTSVAALKPQVSQALVLIDPSTAESGPSPPKKPKNDEAVFLTPLPIISYSKPPTRITKNAKPRPSPSNANQNQLIKALLAQKSAPHTTRPHAPRQTSFIIRASTQTPSGKTQILNLPVSVSTPVSIVRNLAPGTPGTTNLTPNAVLLTQRPTLRSAFVKKSTPSNSTVQTTNVSTVVSSLAINTTTVTSPMTVTPQVTYALSPIATTAGAIVTTTVTSATAKPLMFITTTPKTRARVTPSKTFVPMPHLYKTKQDSSTKQTHNLVRSKVLPPHTGTRVTTPATITMLGPRGLITTTAGVATIVQRPPVTTQSTSSNLPTYQNRYLEPGEIPQIRKVPPRTFPGPRTVSVAQRQTSAAAMQQQATIISQLKASKHAKHHAEAQAKLRVQAHNTPSREILHATSLAALQAESHAKLEAASQARIKATNKPTLLQARLQSTAQNTAVSAQSHVTPTSLQQPVTSQRQMQSLGPIQTVSLAQPHGSVNVQILTPAQAQLLVSSKSQIQATSQAQILGVQGQGLATTRRQKPQTSTQARPQLLTTSQSQPQLLATSPSQTQHLSSSHAQTQLLVSSQSNTQLLMTSQAQSQLLEASQSQVLASSQSRAQLFTTPQARTQLLTTSQARPKLLATSQTQGTLLSTSQVQGQILVASKAQAQLLTSSQSRAQIISTTQSQSQLSATSQVPAQILTASQAQSQISNTSHLVTSKTQRNMTTEQTLTQTASSSQSSITHLKSTPKPRANATLIAQLNAPPQLLISNPQSNITHMQLHGTPSQLNSITQAQLNAISQAQLKTSQQGTPPAHIQMISPSQQSVGVVQPGHRHRLIIKTNTPLLDPAGSEATATTSQTEQNPGTAAHTTSTLTLSTGTTLIMPHYKTTVFKNLSTIGRTESTRPVTPTTSANERVVIRRPVAYFSARRTFPTQTTSSTNVVAATTAATTTDTTTTTTATTGTAVHRHIIRTIPRHVLGTHLQSPVLANPASRLTPVVTTSSSEIPTLIITQTKPNNDNN